MEPWRECCRPSICSTAVTVSMLHVFVLQSWKQFTRTFQDQIAAATTARCSENFLLLLTYLLRSSLGWSEHHDMKIVMSGNITTLQSITLPTLTQNYWCDAEHGRVPGVQQVRRKNITITIKYNNVKCK